MNTKKINVAFLADLIPAVIVIAVIVIIIVVAKKLIGSLGAIGNAALGGILSGQQLADKSAQSQAQLNNLGNMNPLSPQMYLQYGQNSTNTLDATTAESIADQIYNAQSNVFFSPGQDIVAAFNGLFYQIQVSQVANEFQNKYNTPLIDFIARQVEGGGNFSLFGALGNITGDNERGYQVILDYVSKLPTGI